MLLGWDWETRGKDDHYLGFKVKLDNRVHTDSIATSQHITLLQCSVQCSCHVRFWYEGGVLWSYNPRYIQIQIQESQMDECRMTCVKLWHSITTITPIKLSRHCIRHRAVLSTDVQWPRGCWTKDRWWKCLNVKYSFGYKTMKASPLRPFLMLDWNQLTIFICRSVELDKFIFTSCSLQDGWWLTDDLPSAWHVAHWHADTWHCVLTWFMQCPVVVTSVTNGPEFRDMWQCISHPVTWHELVTSRHARHIWSCLIT